MSRARVILLAASVLAAAAGCGSSTTSSAGAQLRQPSAIAVFRGLTLHDPANLVPYLAIANAGRNDLTLVDARTDTIVEAPVRLRPLAVPFPDRPALLVSADLGDGMADLLVGVSAGDSELQLVRTWAVDSGIEGTASVDLAGEDVLALAALPPLPAQPTGEARLVAALAGGRLAVVHYRRSATSEAIEVVPGVIPVQDVGFHPAALAALPGEGTRVYAATLDPIGPGAVRGVAEVDLSTTPWTVRALDARGPTRLVAAARLLERKPGAIEPDEAAFFFPGQTEVRRVYAVLDEGGCGPRKRIDCGIVALDPDKVPEAGDDHLPDDDWSVASGPGWMPYRAPLRPAGRVLALAIAAPPAFRPADAPYPDGYMRLQLDTDSSTVTTAVGVAATDLGQIQFLDLGRFRVASTGPVPVGARVTASLPSFVNTGDATNRDETRLWLRPAPGQFAADADAGARAVGITPGYTPDAFWDVTYQGVLPGLEGRVAEAGWDGTDLWLAVQVGEGPIGSHVTSQAARLYHPALGVAVDDIVVIRNRDAAGNPICTLTPPEGSTAEPQDLDFEVRASGLLPPTVDRPGGAVSLKADASSAEWNACFDALRALAQAAAASSEFVPRLLVTFRSGGLLLVRDAQYAGRPQLDVEYVLEYRADDDADGLPDGPDEDALAAACPLADWDGVFEPPPAPPPPACGAACRAECEKLVLARLARRVHHLAEHCDTAPGTADQACLDRYPGPGFVFPFLNGPALTFTLGVQVGTIGVPVPHREHVLRFSTRSSADALADRPDGTTVEPNGALAFDPSTADAPSAAYRFFVSYPGNQVVDVTPNVSPVSRTAIR